MVAGFFPEMGRRVSCLHCKRRYAPPRPLASPHRRTMTPDEFREIIEKLGLSQIAAARLLGVDARTSRRWASGERDIPPPAVRFLRYLIATKKTGEQAMRVLGD